MAIITPPANLALGPDCTIGALRSDAADTSDPTGMEQARVYGPPRWRQTLASPPTLSPADAAAWQTMRLRLRGHINRLAMHPAAHPYPRGTMRGTLALAATVAAGADTATITGGSGQAGRTLLAGDWLQIGAGIGTSQLIRIAADAIANGSGVITVGFDHVARQIYASGVGVVWDRPTGYWLRTESEDDWGYVGRRGGQQSVALVEAFQ